VLLDAELATLYRVTTKRLNEQVKRNAARFPEDFLFRLSAAEVEILNSPHAVEMSVYVVRAFVHLRELLSSNRELARRFAQLETRLDKKTHRARSRHGAILSAIRELMHPTPPKRRPIGFTADREEVLSPLTRLLARLPPPPRSRP
jgi:hypothetical protein